MPLLGVHISDGVLNGWWSAGGFAAAAVLLALASRRVLPDEIPRIGLISAAVFVASTIHIKVPPTSVHLLLNGLAGGVLGRRAPLAIAVGLALQAVLLGHGGVSALGVNNVILGVPALVAGWTLPTMINLSGRIGGFGRSLLVGGSIWIWGACVLTGLELLGRGGEVTKISGLIWLSEPVVQGTLAAMAVIAGGMTTYLRVESDLAIGLLIGVLTALLTVGLNYAVLILGGQEDWRTLANLVLMAHLPVAAVEGLMLGVVTAFLARTRPDLLRLPVQRPDSGNTSSNGTSH